MTYKPYHNLLISNNMLCICNQGVTGSIPVGGTKYINDLADFTALFFGAGLHMGYKKPEVTCVKLVLIPILRCRTPTPSKASTKTDPHPGGTPHLPLTSPCLAIR